MTAGVALAPAAGAQTLSDDASLRSLSIQSDLGQTRMFPVFHPDVERYDAAVPSGETEVTVRVEPRHLGASVVLETTPAGRCCIEELDYDVNTGDYTLELRTDRSTYFTIKVTAQNGTTKEHVVYVDIASREEKGWRVYNDIPINRLVDDPMLPSHHIRGVWADGSVVLTTSRRIPLQDQIDQKLYVFNAADSSRRASDEFVLSGSPDAGIWSDGTTLWAVDSYGGDLRAYNLSDGSENEHLRADLSPDRYYGNREVEEPRGIWSDGSTLWVVDRDNNKVFAFGLPGTEDCSRYCRQPIKDFDLSDGNDDPWGITAGRSTPTGEVDTWWVTDVYDRKLYAYNRSDGSRNSDRDFDLTVLGLTSYQQFFYGLSATDTIMYVAEYITNRVYSLSMPGVSGPVAPALTSSDATLSSLSLRVQIETSDTELSPTFRSDHTVYAAEVEPDVTSVTMTATATDQRSATVKIDGTISTSSTVSLGAEGTDTTISVEVTAQDGTKKTYRVTVHRRAKSKDATLSGLELSGVLPADLGFASGTDDYDLDVANGFESTTVTATANIAASTVTITLGSQTTTSPTMATLAVDLHEGENEIRVLVTAEDTSKTKTYTMTVDRDGPPPSTDATLSGLVLSGVTLNPVFSPMTDEYTASVVHGVASTTVTPTLYSSAASFAILLDDQADDEDIDLAVGANVIKVVVTAEDTSTMKTYKVTVTRAQKPISTDATLSGLVLSGVTLNPTFSAAGTEYTALVANGVASTTVTPTLYSSAASYAILLDDVADDEEIDLAVGANVIKVVVTAENGTDKKTYTVTVNRAAPNSQPPVNSNPGTSNPGTSNPGTYNPGTYNPGTYNPGTYNPGTYNPGGGSSNTGSSIVGESSGDESDSDSESDDFTPLDDAGDAGTDTEAAINALHRLGVFTGTLCQSNRLCPNDPLQRWIAAVWLVRLIDGDDPAAVTESRFEDVNASSMWEESVWYAPHVERLADLEITVGCTQDPLNFCPDVNLSRAQVASWLARAFDLETDESQGFVDAVGSVHEANINAVVAAGVMSGCSTSPKNFCLTDTVTKGEMARYVYAARNVSLGRS